MTHQTKESERVLPLLKDQNGGLYIRTSPKKEHSTIRKFFLKLLLKALDEPETKKAIIEIITRAIELRSQRLRIALRSL